MQSQIIVDRFLRDASSHSFNLNAYERILLVILASYAGQKKECFPSHLSLSINCGMSIDSVGRHIKLLEKKKLLTVVRTTGNNNLYILTIPETTPTADSTYRSLLVPADSTNPLPLAALPPPASSETNNISNNINEYTSLNKAKKSSKKKTALPENMNIENTHREMANRFGLNIDNEFQHFKEYHLSKDNKFARWDMAFNIWLRNAFKFLKKSPASSTVDIMMGAGHE